MPSITKDPRKYLSVRTEDDRQYQRWIKAAKAEKRRLSDWVRLALDAAASTKGKP